MPRVGGSAALIAGSAVSSAQSSGSCSYKRKTEKAREREGVRGCVRGGMYMAIRRARLQSPRNVTNTVSVASECGE